MALYSLKEVIELINDCKTLNETMIVQEYLRYNNKKYSLLELNAFIDLIYVKELRIKELL